MPHVTKCPTSLWMPLLAAAALLSTAAPAAAQGFGIGARLAWVRSDVDLDVDSVRFVGGQIRLGGGRTGFELSLDRHSETFEALNEKVVEMPIQASLLVRLTTGTVSPYLLGGPGWYRRSVEPADGPDDLRVSTTDFGWHAGGGLEIKFGRHVGLHGDYRYTFLDFGDDEEEDEGFVGRLLPGYKGSMWTLGMTVYF
jgi:opacity protein-like surface antigen